MYSTTLEKPSTMAALRETPLMGHGGVLKGHRLCSTNVIAYCRQDTLLYCTVVYSTVVYTDYSAVQENSTIHQHPDEIRNKAGGTQNRIVPVRQNTSTVEYCIKKHPNGREAETATPFAMIDSTVVQIVTK